jgi:hypothetical protein
MASISDLNCRRTASRPPFQLQNSQSPPGALISIMHVSYSDRTNSWALGSQPVPAQHIRPRKNRADVGWPGGLSYHNAAKVDFAPASSS